MIAGRRIVEDADGTKRVDYAAPAKPEPVPMLRDGVVHVTGTIRGFSDCSAASLRQALADWPRDEPVVVEINSDGGHISEGVAMHLALRNDPRHVTVRIFGQASSTAGLVAMAADRVEIADAGRMAVHFSRYENIGTATAARLRAMADILDEADAQIVDLLAPRCRCSRGWLMAALRTERVFTGREAVEHGFADVMIPNREEPTDGR